MADRRGGVLDVVALLSATVIPLIIAFRPELAGLVQRLMFLVAYVWYGGAALDLAGRAAREVHP